MPSDENNRAYASPRVALQQPKPRQPFLLPLSVGIAVWASTLFMPLFGHPLAPGGVVRVWVAYHSLATGLRDFGLTSSSNPLGVLPSEMSLRMSIDWSLAAFIVVLHIGVANVLAWLAMKLVRSRDGNAESETSPA